MPFLLLALLVFAGPVAAQVPSSPTAFAGSPQSTSSILWTWTDASSNETGFRVMTGAVNLSGDLSAGTTSWLQTGLGINTSTGAMFAQAYNSTGTTVSGSVTRYSLAAVPTALTATGVFQTSATLTWTAGNPGGTVFEIDRATTAGFALVSSDTTASYTDLTLAAGTTYSYRVRALNFDSVATAYTSSITFLAGGVGAPAAPTGFAGTAQTTTSILWTWTDNSTTETGFRLLAGTTNISGNLAADTTSWLQTGLAVNASSGSLLVQVFNSTGSANSSALTRYSLAAVPTGLSSSAVTASGATISWAGAATAYQLERSSGSGFVAFSTSAATSLGDSGLTAASTYYYRVLGYNGDSIATAYASSIAVVTLPTASSPTAPTGFAGTALTTSSIQWSWTDNSSDETGFRVMNGGLNLSGNLAANATTWTQTGLAVNTSTGAFFAQAYNSTGTANSGTASRYTLASVPTGLAAGAPSGSSVTLTWSGNGTVYQLERSTGAGFALIYANTAASFANTGLTAATTYYYRVQALNGDGLTTAYTSSITVITMPAANAPAAPTGFAGTAQSSATILWTWTDASSDETGFRVMSGAVNLSGDLSAGTTLWLQTGLTANATSGILFARAYNSTGTADSLSLTRYSLTDPPNSISATFFGSSVSLTWPTMTNPAFTTWAVDRATDGATFTQFYYSSAAAAYTDTGLVAASTYSYRIRSVNFDLVSSSHANATATVYTGSGTIPAIPTGFAGTAQTTTSILWSWTDTSTNETGFRIMAGATNVSGDLAADTTFWLQAGLGVNTSSGSLLVQAFNSTGTANSTALTRYSLAAVPTGLGSSGVQQTSATISWTAGNPGGTVFELDRSSTGAFALVASTTAASYFDAALAASSTYYYRVRALNGDSIATAYTSSISFVTAPAPIAAPSAFAGTAQTTTSILWTWTDNATTETGFRVMAGATNVSGNLAANTTSWLQSGLGVNTSSGSLLVQVFNSTGAANSGAVTRYSLASVPTALAATGVTASSATISWAGAGTSYQLEASTGAGFTTISSAAGASFGSTGLTPASTYYYRVLAYNADLIATAYASSIAVVTLPAASAPTAPSSFAGAAQTTTSILWTWTDNATTETGFRLLAGTTNVSGNLAANTTSWLQSGLGVNASSGALTVEVFNSTGTNSAGPLTVYSLAAAPTGLAASGVSQTSATVSWSAAGNPGGTLFELERSTGAGFSLLVSSSPVSYSDASLTSASTYSYRVRALNASGLATAYSSSITFVTAPTPPPAAPTGFAGAAQSGASILWTWTDNATTEDGFRVVSGTISVSGNLAVNATSWLQTGLGANALTGPYAAQAYNAGGTVDSSTASRTTLAAVPTGLAATGVYQTSATVSWSQGTNAAGTTFQLERSTGTGYGQLLSAAATYYFDGNLSPGATHYYRVRAINGEAVATAYASSIAVVALPPPGIPGAPGTPVGTVLGISSISWTWTLASGATNHFLYRVSDNAVLSTQPAGPFVQTGLSGNTAYGLRVAGVNLGGLGPLSAAATVYTWAAVPSGAAAVSIASTSLTASWGLNGNAASTVAQLDRSTNAVVYSTLTTGAVTSYADADLLGCSTYYYRVRNANAAGVLSAYASFQGVTANTIPAPPAGLTASANAGGTVSLGWNLSGTEGVTGYRLYWDAGTGTVNFAAPLAVLGSTATAFTTGVLTSSASYTFALRTAHRCGTIETTGALAMSGAAIAAATVRAAIKEPDSGRRVDGNSVTILAELTAGTPSDVQQIVFQYKLATSTSWLSVNAVYLDNPNPDFAFPYFTHANATGLAAGSYDLRAVAYDRNGVPDPAPPAVRVVVDHTSPDISETLTLAGEIKKDQVVSNAVTSVVETAGDGATDPAVRVTIPAGLVTSATATVSVIANPVITTAAPSGQSFVGSAIKIDLSNGQTALNGVAAISLTYPDTVLFPSQLQIYYLNEATGQWSRDFASTVNTTSRTVTGLTPHFSTFALLLGAAFAPDLNSVQVYPVPFKPNGRNPDEGRPFTAGDAASGILFSNLAMGSEIKIYTLTGRLVSSLDNAPISGTVRWDAKNQDGRDVASGAYFAVITATGHKSVVKKLVIIR